MTQDSQIRRNPDGSIDMSYYLGKGRDCRSRAALRFVARARLVLASHLTGGLRTSPSRRPSGPPQDEVRE